MADPLSSADEEIVASRQREKGKAQRRDKRKQKQLATQQILLSCHDVITTLPPIFDDHEEPPEPIRPVKKKIKQEVEKVAHYDSIKEPIQLTSIDQIIQKHPHLGLNRKGEPICDHAKLKLLTHQIPEEQKQKIQGHKITTAELIRAQLHNHRIDTSLQHQVASLPTTTRSWYREHLKIFEQKYGIYESQIHQLHTGECTTSLLELDIRRPRISLECRSASLESILLQESGLYWLEEKQMYVMYPGCIHGSSCIGMLHTIRGQVERPMLLMSSMNQEQYNALIQDAIQSPYDSQGSRIEWENQDGSGSFWSTFQPQPCVLCYRFIACSEIIQYRKAIQEGEPTPLVQPSKDPSTPYDMITKPIQMYYNKIDEEEGYQSHYTMTQTFRDCCFSPIVMANLCLLYSTLNPKTGRGTIHQDLLIWKPPQIPLEPELGINLSTFLNRNKQQIGKYRIPYESYIIQDMIRCLLRDQTHFPRIDLVEVAKQMTNQMIPPLQTYLYTLIYDAYLLSSSYPSSNRYLDWSCLSFDRIISDMLLPSVLPLQIQNASWFYPLAEVGSPLTKIISKIIVNYRGQSRTVANIIRKLLVKKTVSNVRKSNTKPKVIEYDDHVLVIVKKMILCALLGNYMSDTCIRPYDSNVRLQLYQLFTDPKYDAWVIRLLEHCPSILTLCVRKYMIHSLDHNPAMLQHITEMISYPRYKEIVIQGMNFLCHMFTAILKREADDLSDSFYQCLQSIPEQRIHHQHLWKCGHKQCRLASTCILRPTSLTWSMDALSFHLIIQSKLELFELWIKEIAIRHPYVNPAGLLKQHRRVFPLIPLFPQKQQVPEDHDEEEEEKEQDNYLFPRYPVSDFLYPDQEKALQQLISASGPLGYGLPIQRILDFLPEFYISQYHTDYIKQLFKHYRNQSLSSQSIQRALLTLRILDPHAYNLIQLVSELLEQAQRRFKLTDLPLHVTKAQIETIAGLYPEQPQNLLLNSLVSFVFCSVCYHIYSQLADHNSVYKNAYSFGLRDASVSYMDGSTYCKSNKKNARGTCGEHPLVHIPMIGRMLWFRQKCIILCGQCGQLMSFDAKDQHYVAYTTRGPSCLRCTKKIQEETLYKLVNELQTTYTEQTIHCWVCEKTKPSYIPSQILLDHKGIFMYGTQTFLCKEHHHQHFTVIKNQLEKKEIDSLNRDHVILELLESRLATNSHS